MRVLISGRTGKHFHYERVETGEASGDDRKVLRNLNAKNRAPGIIRYVFGRPGIEKVQLRANSGDNTVNLSVRFRAS